MVEESLEISRFNLLPEGCIANIISFSCPKDACTAAAVSLGVKSAAESDTVWERFLPPDYGEIVSGSYSPMAAYSTKKELYFLLCGSLLLDGGKLSFRLDKSTGKKCYMLCSRELQIAWVDDHIYWTWTSLPDSRFAEVAALQSVCWLDIHATFQAQMLSPNTNYAAYLVFKLLDDHQGLDCSSKALIKIVREKATEIDEVEKTSTVYIVQPPRRRVMGRRRRRRSGLAETNRDDRIWHVRSDGWLEIKLGIFFIGEGDNQCGSVQIHFSETEHLHWKRGLVVEGIELRPKEVEEN